MKKSLLFLVALMVTTMISAQTFEVDNVTYTVLSEDDKTAEVTGFADFTVADFATTYANLTIPATAVNTNNSTSYSVVSVGIGAFNVNTKKTNANPLNDILVSVSLPSTVVTLKDFAFLSQSALTTINLDNVVETGASAVASCPVLSNIGTLSKMETLGNYTFSASLGLTSIEIPVVKTIGTGAISGTSGVVVAGGVTRINIPNSVTEIGGIFLGRLWDLTEVQVNWTDLSIVTIEVTNFFRNLDLTTIKVYVPTGTKDDYLAHALWGTFPADNIIEGELPALPASINIEQELEFSFFPNPTNGVISIKSKQLDNANVNVYNLNGTLLLNQNISGVASEINISDFAAGIYMIQVEVENAVFTKRIVKQ